MKSLLLLFLLSLAATSFAQVAPVPQQSGFPILNPSQDPSSDLSNILVADIDNDGYQEIVTFFGRVGPITELRAYEYNGTLKFSIPLLTHVFTWSEIAAGDIDGDGDLELAWTGKSDSFAESRIYLSDHNGNLLTETMDAFEFIVARNRIIFADMNGDGSEEIIVLDESQVPQHFFFYALCGDGSVLPGWPVEHDLLAWYNPFDPAQAQMFIYHYSAGDLNYDNSYQLFVGAERVIDSISLDSPVFRTNGDGSSVNGFPRVEPNANSVAGIVLADFNQDRLCEFGGAGTNAYKVLRDNGITYRATNLPFGQGSFTTQTIGQFDDDEDLEILFRTNYNRIGDPWPGAGAPFEIASNPNLKFEEPCAADIDGDGISEIGGILLDGHYDFAVVDNELNFLPGWPVSLSSRLNGSGIERATCAADLDNDGDLEMIVVIPEGIYAFDFPSPSGKVWWSGKDGNAARNRFVDHRNYPNQPFVRGDINSDSLVNITDFALLIRHQFASEINTLCKARFDVNDDGFLNLADSLHLLDALFVGNASIAAPYPACEKMQKAPYRKLYCLEAICQ